MIFTLIGLGFIGAAVYLWLKPEPAKTDFDEIEADRRRVRARIDAQRPTANTRPSPSRPSPVRRKEENNTGSDIAAAAIGYVIGSMTSSNSDTPSDDSYTPGGGDSFGGGSSEDW